MKKSAWMIGLGILFSVASLARADVRSDSLNVDPRFIDDVDLIWFYPNMVTTYQNLFDVRTNKLTDTGVWGGFLDGEHSGLGVIGVYVNRPYGYDGTRSVNYGAPGCLGTGNGSSGNWQIGPNNWTAANAVYNGHFTAFTPENKLDLFWGSKGEKGSFGFQLNYADAEGNVNGNNFPLSGSHWDQNTSNNSSSAAYSATQANGDSRVIGVNLGLGAEDMGFFNSVNLHAGYSLGLLDMEENDTPKAATTRDNNSLKDNGIYTLSLGILAQSDMGPDSALRLFANVDVDQDNQTEHLTQDISNNGLHNEPGDVDEHFASKYNDVISTLGIGCSHKVLEGKAAVGTSLQGYWITDDTKISATQQDGIAASALVVPQSYDELTHNLWDIDWNADVEAKPTGWLTLRAGINRPILWRVTSVSTLNVYAGNAVQSTSKTTTTYDGYFGNSASTYSMGFGINFANFQLDARASTTSLFSTVTNVAPGNGIFFTNNTTPAPIISSADADIRYQF